MKVVILNAPCNGFGDVVFAFKLLRKIEKKYDVLLFTPRRKDFSVLTDDMSKIFSLTNTKGEELTKSSQCRRFSNLRIPQIHKLTASDVYINAPLQVDFTPSTSDVSNMLGFNVKNLLILTEYNHFNSKKHDKNVLKIGVGEEGILYPDGLKPLKYGHNNYTIAYAGVGGADIGHTPSEKQKFNFLMKSYFLSLKNESIDVHASKAVYMWCKKSRIFKSMIFVRCDVDEDNGEDVVVYGDKFPVPYLMMLSAWKNASANVVCTGDQSLSDAIFFLHNKVEIFYQLMSWKEDLGSALVKTWQGSKLMGTKRNKKCFVLLPPSTTKPKSAVEKILKEIKTFRD